MYEGEWKNGVTWNGIYYDKDGWKYFGSWKNGEIWNGTEYDKNGNIIKKILHGRNIKIRKEVRNKLNLQLDNKLNPTSNCK